MTIKLACGAVAVLALAGCDHSAEQNAAYEQASAAVWAIACAKDRSELSLGLNDFADAAARLDEETRQSSIDDMAEEADCAKPQAAVKGEGTG